MRTLTRAIELMFRVQVAGVDVHSLQCYLDKNGIVTVVSQSLSRVGQVPVKDGSNLGWHVVRRSRIVLGDGLAPRKRSGTASFFFPRSKIAFFQNVHFLGHLGASKYLN